MPNPTYLFILKCLVDPYRGGHVVSSVCIVPKLVCAVSFDEWVGWGTSLVWPKSEAIDPTLDDFSGKCTELEHVVKLINNPEGAGPPKS